MPVEAVAAEAEFVFIHGIMLQIPQAVQVLKWFDSLAEEQQNIINQLSEESVAADEANKTLLQTVLQSCGIDIESWRSIVKNADYDLEKWVDEIRQKKISVEDGSLHKWD